MQLLDILLKREMFPSPVFSSQVLRCGRERLQRHRPILYYAAEASAADAASACEEQESGSGALVMVGQPGNAYFWPPFT